MRCGTGEPQEPKAIYSAAFVIDLNTYVSAFPGAKASDEIDDTKWNKILLNSMKNGWSKQAHVQDFDCETNT